jgi:hypothetical protein
VGVIPFDDDEQTYDHSFYLGAPKDFDLLSTGACAVFFHKVSKKVSFGDGDPRITDGTCRSAMSSDCVDALLSRAKKTVLGGLSSETVCDLLEKGFTEHLDPACADFSTLETGWASVHAHRKSFLLPCLIPTGVELTTLLQRSMARTRRSLFQTRRTQPAGRFFPRVTT